MKSIVIVSLLILTIGIGVENVFAQLEPENEDPVIEEPEIIDEEPPVVTVPEDITRSPENFLGAVVSFLSSAFDEIDGSVDTECIPSSGSFFMKGITIVTCTATDSSGNVGEASFSVNIVDEEPPVVTVPEDIVIDSTVTSGTIVTFSTSAVDEVDGVIPTICSPESSSEFVVGTTIVTCTATDSSGNVGEASFSVTVNNLITILNEELLELETLTPDDLENVGTHVSKFVRTSNTLFQLERQGIKEIQADFRYAQFGSIDEITQLNTELSQFRQEMQDLRQEYQEIFESYRNEVKQLIKEKKGLTVEDKKAIQEFEKSKIRIQNTEAESIDSLNSIINTNLNHEIKINEKKLQKLNQLINLEKYPLSGITDSQLAKWKQEQIELFSTVKALKIIHSSSDKDQKEDVREIIKEIKNQIKEEKKKEKGNSEKSEKSNGGDKSNKSSKNKGKKK